MKIKRILGIILVIIGMSLVTFSLTHVWANENHHHGDHKCEYKCNKPTPTPTIVGCDEDCITPTPSIVPDPTEGPVNDEVAGSSATLPQGNTSTTEAPAIASCTIGFDKPILQGFTALGNGSVVFSFWPVGGVDKYSIVYGYTPDNLLFGENDIPATSTSVQLNGLTPGKNVWAQVWAWKDGCAEVSNLFDPVVK